MRPPWYPWKRDGGLFLRLISRGIRSRPSTVARPRCPCGRYVCCRAAFCGSRAWDACASLRPIAYRSRGRPCPHRPSQRPCDGHIDAIPIFAIEGEARDRQRLALRAGWFHPIIAATGDIIAIPDLGYHALEPDLTGLSEYFCALDLEAVAELNVGVLGDLL